MACSKIVFQSRAEAKNHARKLDELEAAYLDWVKQLPEQVS